MESLSNDDVRLSPTSTLTCIWQSAPLLVIMPKNSCWRCCLSSRLTGWYPCLSQNDTDIAVPYSIHTESKNNVFNWQATTSYRGQALVQTDRPRSTQTSGCVRLDMVDWRRRGRTAVYHVASPSVSSIDVVTPTPPSVSCAPATASLTATCVHPQLHTYPL